MENVDPAKLDAKSAVMKQLALSVLTTYTWTETTTVYDAKETARLVIVEMSALVYLVREDLLWLEMIA